MESDDLDFRFGQAARTLRPGDRLGTDIVKSVGADRMVLVRPASVDPASGESIVLVHFDAEGRPRVFVISEKDSTAQVPPEVK